jgi:hypothetical protein
MAAAEFQVGLGGATNARSLATLDHQHLRGMAIGARRLHAHQKGSAMIRLLLVGLFSYVTYRYARAFVRSVPDDFEPVGLLAPPKPATATDRSRMAKATARVRRAR